MERIRITHPHDAFTGRVAHVVERVDQHSLYTYIVTIKGHDSKRAYQRNEFKFLKTLTK